MDVSGALLKLRRLSGFTQAYIAQLMGVSQSSYRKLETGETKVSLEHLEKLSDIYNKNIVDILNSIEDSNRHQPIQIQTNEELKAYKTRISILEDKLKASNQRIADLERTLEAKEHIIKLLSDKE